MTDYMTHDHDWDPFLDLDEDDWEPAVKRKARKTYKCQKCSCQIHPGTEYYDRNDRVIGHERFCLKCG